MSRRSISSPSASAVGPYSHAVDDGSHVFCSGQTPLDPETGELDKGGVSSQTSQCFQNLISVLKAAGLTSAEMNEAYAEHFDEPFPARTTVGVASLPLGAQVEIELVAKKPG